MFGSGNEAASTIHYPTSPASGGGGSGATAWYGFTLYPFDNGKTLVTWTDSSDARFRALVATDYSALPPLVTVPGSGTAPGVLLLLGGIDWNPACETLTPTLLPATQQTVFAHLPSPIAAMNAATSGGTAGAGVVIDSAKHFFRIRRMAVDADGDSLDWAAEVFQFGTDPDNADTDGDGLPDDWEIAWGLDPRQWTAPHTWLVGSGLTVAQLFAQGATPATGAGATPPVFDVQTMRCLSVSLRRILSPRKRRPEVSRSRVKTRYPARKKS